MWRSGLLRGLTAIKRSILIAGNGRKLAGFGLPERPVRWAGSAFLSAGASPCSGSGNGADGISCSEAKRVLRLINIEALKRKLEMEGKEVIGYSELLTICQSMGVSRSGEESAAFARVLDEAGVVLLFRDKVYLHPDKVVELVSRAVPLALTSEDDPRREELNRLQKKKVEIDMLAHRQVRQILWSGLGILMVHLGLFFRLTFWEFSWDVMEPIAFFATASGLVIGYAYFLFTSRDPTYQDLMKRLFLRRQRKIIKKHNFDINRFIELHKQCRPPLECAREIDEITGIHTL